GAGAARLVSCEPAGGATEPEDALIHKVSCPAGVRPAVAAALAGVRLADSLDSVPPDIPSGTTWVTRGGAVVRGNCFEHWSAETPTATPLTVKHAADTARAALEAARTAAAAAEARLAECAARIRELGGAIQNARAELDSRRRAMAQKEGEQQALSRESAEARRKLETVSFEFDSISEATRSGVEERQAIHRERDAALGRREGVASDIQARTSELHDLENEHSRIQGELVELRVRCGGMQNALENAESQRESATARVAELRATAAARAGSIENYRRGSETLERTNTEAQSRLERLSQEVSENGTRLETLTALRAEQSAATESCASLLAEKRKTLDTVRAAKADTDIQLAEHRMRRQNQIDRTTSEYGVSLDQIINWPEPEWPEGAPSFESIETQVAEIRLKIEAMGPVNLVAIEEYSELEERHAFLAKQEADLVQAKEQLMDMIRQINKTTSDLFADTFAKINENFQKMFTRLFNGGSAKLVLVNEEDILECGIEIIGRPPGKKLQNISLLSGGERTLTAVALLFAIYMIKPSPFCLLDELDAPLDDSNIGRFIDVLRDFLSQSQFVIITHNQHTISAANILYGVTMPEKGVSKMVSMRFRKREEQERAQQLAPA
ncbi:MAG: hypothetical protein FJ224_07305, partial [Lentisphaerae bacterium]|nr:hypothetical protein [Lentisphaerota bacterium]